MKVIKPPQDLTAFFDHRSHRLTKTTIFLAGSIEMGKAENWQDKLIDMIKDEDILVLNPRRDDWDSTWEQSKKNPKFVEQVEWELRGLGMSDLIVMYFDPNTKSPITLLELGLFACTKKLVVFCPEGFWRKGNVDIVCQHYNIPVVKSFEEMLGAIKIVRKWKPEEPQDRFL